MGNRRAALEGLLRILDASAPEDLFTGPEEDAVFLYGLLVDVARARRSSVYWEICRTARRRGVTPEYVVDRAAVLLATIEERRRADLYRILGVPALASGETIRQHWLDLAKQHHPDGGGDGALFRRAKQAYEALRDPVRRVDYERFWLRALGPFERVAPREESPRLEVMRASVRSRPREPVDDGQGRVEPVLAKDEPPRPTLRSVASASAPPARPDGHLIGVGGVLARIELLLAPIGADELESLRADLQRTIDELEGLRDRLAALASIKHRLGA